jgi:hypothetical protein
MSGNNIAAVRATSGSSSSSHGDAVGASRGRTTLRIRVTPRSGRTGVFAGEGNLVVRVRAPAEGGKATEEALRTVAAWLGFARLRVELVTGSASRLKTLSISGIEPADLRKRIAQRL